MAKALDAFRTISEVASDLDVQKHVLRFWENKFPQVRPMKRGGGRRYYRPDDLDLLRGIRYLLHREGYTIKGVQKLLREQGLEFVKSAWQRGEANAATTGSAKAEPGKPGRKPRKTSRQGDTPAIKLENSARNLKAAPTKRNDQLVALEKLLAQLEDCRRILCGVEGEGSLLTS